MKAQYEYENKEIQKAGCFLLSHISFFETSSRKISDSMVQRIYDVLVSKKLMEKNCFIGAKKEEILFAIGEVVGRPVKDCCYIGKWYPDRPLESYKPLEKAYNQVFSSNKHSRFCIEEYRDAKGNQHFFQVDVRGNEIYDPYPLSPTVRYGKRASTRLYYIQFEDEA